MTATDYSQVGQPAPSCGRKLLVGTAVILGLAAAGGAAALVFPRSGSGAEEDEQTTTYGYNRFDKKGCSNRAEASKQLGHHVANSSKACADMCNTHDSCVSYNFQTKDCAGNDQVAPGTCYLYSEECKVESNDCWELGVKDAMLSVARGQTGYFCPAEDDFLTDVAAGGDATVTDRGYTITGAARVSTKYSWNLEDGGMSFDLDLSGMPTGKVRGDNFLKSLTYLHMPGSDGQSGQLSATEVACTGTGSTATDFCPEVEIMEAYGQAAWSQGWYLEETGAHEGRGQQCMANTEAQNRPKCRAERFFESTSIACHAAESDFDVKEKIIDASKPIHVKTVLVDSSGFITTYSQGHRSVTIGAEDLSDGTQGKPSATSILAVAYAMREFGAAFSSRVKTADWVPGMHKATGDSANWTQSWCDPATIVRENEASVKVSNLMIYGTLVRGDGASGCTQTAIDHDADKLNERASSLVV